jgi:hypothetical protein
MSYFNSINSSETPITLICFIKCVKITWIFLCMKCNEHICCLYFMTYNPGILQARCQEELLDPPDLASTMAAAYSMFQGKLIGSLGFSRRGEYIGGRAASGGGPGGPTTWRHGQGLARATLWCGRPLAPPSSQLWTPSLIGKNRNFGFCFVQFWEYFLCSFSETQK